ncbi:MAG: DegT/DnrJ/EryC1/StrS aminotransferase family protein [Pseudomonadota bacterium]
MQFIDLQAQRRRIEAEVDAAVSRVIRDGRYVMGPDVAAFEAVFGRFLGGARVVSCANGTDALALALMALETGPGDAVFVPSFTFIASVQVIPWVGAEPVFVDIDPETYNIDPASLVAAVDKVEAEGRLKPHSVIAVDLFGQPADYPAISEIARAKGLRLIADAAQSVGATLDGKTGVDYADLATTSFFPAKPLGCYGDGGAVASRDEQLADLVESLRVYGKVTPADAAARDFKHDPKYLSLRVGMNSRLDSIQAAILLEKLKIFEDELDRRDAIAARYSERLAQYVSRTPTLIEGARSSWAQYVVEHEERDALAAHLKAQDIPTAVYYPVPVHQQDFCADYPAPVVDLSVTEAKSPRVLALPMHAYLDEAAQDCICDAVADFALAGAA